VSRRPWPRAISRRKITVDARGEILELKNTINTMVDQLSSFASEVTRVAREVGTEGQAGRSGGGARRGRYMARSDGERQLHGRQPDGNQVRNIAEVTTAVAKGDLSARLRSTCAAKFSN
jgi:HAMP domain-containing protein